MAITRLGPNNSTNISGINLTSQVTGTLPIANGGTAATSFDPASLVLIKSVTASDASNIIFDNDASGVVFDDAYKCYMFNLHRVYGATNDVKIHMITRTGASDSGGTFRNQIMYHTYDGSTSTNPASAPNTDKLYQCSGTVRNTNPEYFQGQFFCYGIGENTRMMMTGQAAYKNNSGYHHNEAFSSSSDTTQTINGMKFQMASGNIYGTISLYGIKT
tara:strand:+ start:131 stop:781 length:651 start_codon:yes stop_codon:yes gene_type:complete